MGHLNSNLLWEKYASSLFSNGKQILEIGPAGYPSYYQKYAQQHNDIDTYHCLDVRTDFISGAEANPHFIYAKDGYHYPLEDDMYDIVFSDQVLAHVPFFWDWYKELKRIAKPGGLIITICSQSYPACPSPTDGWRVSADGMLALNEYVGLEVMLCKTESAEMEKFKIQRKPGHYFPGASIQNPYHAASDPNLKINLVKRNWNNIIGRIPGVRAFALNPVQVAFDTITIARKPV